jgi:hypothetical protein
MKWVFVLTAIILAAFKAAAADESAIYMYIECDGKECISLPMKQGQGTRMLQLRPQPELVIDGAALQEIYPALGPFGEPVLTIALTPEKSAEFEKITAENIHKTLAIVFNGEVMTNPVIQEKISGGRLQITLGAGHDPNDRFWERLPWLRDRVAKEQGQIRKAGDINLLVYAGGTIAMVVAALWFAFKAKRPRKE